MKKMNLGFIMVGLDVYKRQELVNPDNWCPIEQDFYVDGQAFTVVSPRPYRIHFKTGLVSNDLGKDLGIKGVYGRSIEGGAGVLLDMPLNPSKELSHLTLETLSDVYKRQGKYR